MGAQLVDDRKAAFEEKRATDKLIRDVIKREDQELYRRHPWLHQKGLIGSFFVAFSILGMLATAAAYVHGAIHWAVAVALQTFLLSMLHEVEHDIFHGTYFGRPGELPFEAAMFLIHVFKWHASPWWRMKIHLLHHGVSGQKLDVEERLVGLGMPLGIPRLLVTLSPFFYVMACPSVLADNKDFDWMEPLLQSKWQSTSGVAVLVYAGHLLGAFTLSASVAGAVQSFVLLVTIPSHVRHVCLSLVASMSHYYEDNAPGVVHEQVQILNPWWLVPFQSFCWFFGSTHWVHHFYVQQPFWVRTYLAAKINREAQAFVDTGVLRQNDAGVLKYAKPNRRGPRCATGGRLERKEK